MVASDVREKLVTRENDKWYKWPFRQVREGFHQVQRADMGTRYKWLRDGAKWVKIVTQIFIGLSVFILLLPKVVGLGILMFTPHSAAKTLFADKQPLTLVEQPLALVGYALLLSAGIELAYMLFTPELDEALDPLIVGLASAALLVLSGLKGGDVTWEIGFTILVLALAVGFLFFIRFRYFPRKEQDDHEEPAEEARQASNEESERVE